MALDIGLLVASLILLSMVLAHPVLVNSGIGICAAAWKQDPFLGRVVPGID